MKLDPHSFKLKKCPECSIEMHEVKLETHYGTDLIIEQCARCGGLWFDALEVFRAKPGSAKEIMPIDLAVLGMNVVLPKRPPKCPMDDMHLQQFTDPLYPEGLQIYQCEQCSGVWFNRGEFHTFEGHRASIRERSIPDNQREKTPDEKKKDQEFYAAMGQAYENATERGDTETIKHLTDFLAGPKPDILREIEKKEDLREQINTIYKGYGFIKTMQWLALHIAPMYLPLASLILVIGIILRSYQQEDTSL